MANHKSAEKRNRQAQLRRLRNRINRTKMKNVVRSLNEAIDSGSVEEAKEALQVAVPVIAKTASKGTIHKKNASRRKGRLMKALAAIEKSK